jgi:tol-pal system protein YbgF
MTFSASRFVLTATALLALGAAVPAPAAAQYDPRYGVQQGGAQEADEEGGGLFGGLFGRGGERPRREPTYAPTAATELTTRLDRLENQLRQLTGAVEQLQYRNQQLEQQVRALGGTPLAGSAESAGLRRPGPMAGPAMQPGTQAAPLPPASAVGSASPGRRSDAFDPSENPGAPGAPQALGSIPSRGGPPPVITANPPVGAPGGRESGAPLDLGTLADRGANDPRVATDAPPPVASVPGREPRVIPGALPPPPPRNPNATGGQQLASAPTDTPRDAYAMAQGFMQRKDYAMAEGALREFLKKYPSDRLAPEAHYWLGETLFQRQRYRDAAESFLTVSTKFGGSGKAPDALMRLGQSLAALGEKEAACATLGEVLRKYPKASPGVKQSVEREQKRVRC